MANENLQKAKEAKNDEFYTQLNNYGITNNILKERWFYVIAMTRHGQHFGNIYRGAKAEGRWMKIYRCCVRSVIMRRWISEV